MSEFTGIDNENDVFKFLEENGVSVNYYLAEEYLRLIDKYGEDAVIDGIRTAAAGERQNEFSYVMACILVGERLAQTFPQKNAANSTGTIGATMKTFRSVDEALNDTPGGMVQFSHKIGRTQFTLWNDMGKFIGIRESKSGALDALGTYDLYFGESVDELLEHDDVATVSFYRVDNCVVCSVEAASLLELANGEGIYANDALKQAVNDYG